jgi:hypothetical protein
MVLALQRLQSEGAPKGDQIFGAVRPQRSWARDAALPLRRHGPVLPAAVHSTTSSVSDKTFPETNTGSPATLRDFIDWARAECGDPRKYRHF